MAEVAIKLNLNVEDLIGIVKQLPLGERARLKDCLDRQIFSKPSDTWDSEGLLLAQSPAFRAIVETVERDIEEGRTRPIEGVWDAL